MRLQTQPTVSAIIPVYNGSDCIRKAIDSALAQTHPLHELIVVDDGSTDNITGALEALPVKILRQANSGPGKARNAGATLATGAWLAFLDHDDTWHPEKTASQLELSNDQEIGVIYSTLKARDAVPFNWKALWKRNIVGTPSGVMVRRECFFDAGGFDERRSLIGTEDYNLWMRIALTEWRIVRCPGTLYDYTPPATSLSRRFLSMANAECFSYEEIGQLAKINPRSIAKRKVAVANQYIRELIGVRDMKGARQLIAATGALKVSPDLLAAVFGPDWILLLRKRLRSKMMWKTAR